MLAAITATLYAVKKAVLWLVTSGLGAGALRLIAKISFLGFFLLGLAAAGFLPGSPFQFAFIPLMNMINQIPYFGYVAAFIPVAPILATFGTWVAAITGFHIIKVYLRKSGIIK